MTMKIRYNQPNLTESDLEAARRALSSSHIAGNGPLVGMYEHEIAQFTGAQYAVAVNSATTALEICYSYYFGETSRAISVPSLTFAATATALQRARTLAGNRFAPLKFVDPNRRTLVTAAKDVSVSYSGYPLEDWGVIADDAHSIFEGMFNYGNYRYLARILSHHAVKPLACGEGGTILTGDDKLVEYARNYRSHWREATGFTGNTVASNYRMQEVNAAILLNRLPRVEEERSRRRELANVYKDELSFVAEIDLPLDHEKHSYHLFATRLPIALRDRVKSYLELNGVESVIHYKPVYDLPAFDGKHEVEEGRYASYVYATELSIPVHHGLSKDNILFIAGKIKEVIQAWKKS